MSMNVQDLIEMLEQMDPAAMVIISRDPEGNNFAPIEDHGVGFFDTTFSEYYDDDSAYDVSFDEEIGDDDDGYKKPKRAVPAVVLWPAY